MAVLENCQRELCRNPVPAALAAERLCLDHFLDEAFVRADHAIEDCRNDRTLRSAELEWLLADALSVVTHLEDQAALPNPDDRDRMLELLLMLANLHEYVAHHSVRLDIPA